eukprot:CAMPEP_0117518952 /NCGR_PEP_ID=MMETSP0784-20121206/32399_1 /TAXON_ID=39447 /ORGANISM="" /LENGTH=169 /DNA_ID=CAMNT_0005314893 /DNA_START=702 /DNA_END=1209 /DNA_ORIENTATION=+
MRPASAAPQGRSRKIRALGDDEHEPKQGPKEHEALETLEEQNLRWVERIGAPPTNDADTTSGGADESSDYLKRHFVLGRAPPEHRITGHLVVKKHIHVAEAFDRGQNCDNPHAHPKSEEAEAAIRGRSPEDYFFSSGKVVFPDGIADQEGLHMLDAVEGSADVVGGMLE